MDCLLVGLNQGASGSTKWHLCCLCTPDSWDTLRCLERPWMPSCCSTHHSGGFRRGRFKCVFLCSAFPQKNRPVLRRTTDGSGGTACDHLFSFFFSATCADRLCLQVAFAAVVIPLSCMELSEQICVQLSMGALNLCILLFMAVCCVFALYGDAVDNVVHNSTANSTNVTTAGIGGLGDGGLYPGVGAGDAIEAVRAVLRRHLEASWTAATFPNGSADTTSAAIASTTSAVREPGPPHETPFAVPLVDFSGFGLMLSTTVTSLLCQHSVPGLIQPLDKRYTSRGALELPPSSSLPAAAFFFWVDRTVPCVSCVCVCFVTVACEV